MPTTDENQLPPIASFEDLVDYLRDFLDWPIEAENADEITFEYEPDELGIDRSHAVKIKSIKQIRPLVDGQPWGVFFIEFESKRLPVVVLRRILRAFVQTSRRSDPDRPVWRLDDLLFISALGEVSNRGISFAHFRKGEGQLAELRTFSWDRRETHFYYLRNFNLEKLRWPPDEQNPMVWSEQWRQAFPTPHRYVIKRSQELAREMAHHATVVRDLVAEVFRLEMANGPLHQLFKSFKEVLLHDLTPQTFADMVAQTVTYGLFSAAIQTPEELSYDHLVELIPNTNPFLKELLAELTESGGLDLEELGIDQLMDLLRHTDMAAIVRDFGRQSGDGREDPIVHFYELFLNEYDKEQRVQRGVFYTPDPVVSYIVRSVDYLLREEFGLEDGLADTTINPDTGKPWVQILDPATGTGTFLAHVIDKIEQTVKAKQGVDWNDYVPSHLLPRLNGFELLMAPYAVAHMKLGLKLKHTDYNFLTNLRLRVYLTNALDDPTKTLPGANFLAKEANEANAVKREIPISVVIGNPPYAKISANRGDYAEGLIDTYKEFVRRERNLQPLSDDYLKFLGFSHQLIQQTGCGIVAMITNHSYLHGIIHRGVRKELCDFFDKIYILDLHGNSLMGEISPTGGVDKNVFDIRQGVAIGIFVKSASHTGQNSSEIYHFDIWGAKNDKYSFLNSRHYID